MSILFGLLLARRFYCRSALSLSPGRTGGLLPRINAPTQAAASDNRNGSFTVNYTRTFERNSLQRSVLGFEKNSAGVFSSTILPSSMKITLVAASLAKPIS